LRISEEEKKRKIVELYKSGSTYSYLQKRYHISSKSLSKLVKGIEVKCAICGKLKGKTHFHAHHPDRDNRPNFTIPLCPSCHAKEEARLRREKENQSRSPLSSVLPATENLASKPSNTSLSVPLGPLSPKAKKVLIGAGIALAVEALFPGFFERRWQEIQARWRRS